MSKVDCASRKGTKTSQKIQRKRNSGKWKVQNRYLLEEQAESVGTSAKKIKLSEDNYDIDYDSTFGYRILQFASVFSILSEVLVRSTCHKNVKFTEASKQGLGFKIVVTCDDCAPVYIDSCFKIENKAYEINRRIIYAMRLLGIGINGIKKFCAFMNLPQPVFQKSYTAIINHIHEAAELVCFSSMKKAAQEEKKNRSKLVRIMV